MSGTAAKEEGGTELRESGSVTVDALDASPALGASGVLAAKGKLRPRSCGARTTIGLLEIDDVRSEFTVDLELFLDWSEPSMAIDGATRSVLAFEELPADAWRPIVTLANANKMEKTLERYYSNVQKGWMFVHLCWTATIREPLELMRFPFDRQRLKLYFNSANTVFHHSELASEHFPLSWPQNFKQGSIQEGFQPVFVKAYTALPHWRLYPTQKLKYWQNGASHTIHTVLRVERKFEYYWYNIVIPLFLLVGASLATCFLDPKVMSERVSISVTFFLALVAFKYVLTQLLPHISYLTMLDKYVLACFTLLAMGIGENIAVRFYVLSDSYDSDDLQVYEGIYAAVIGGVWIIGHLLLFVLWQCGAFRKSWTHVEKHDDKSKTKELCAEDMEIRPTKANREKYTVADYRAVIAAQHV